MKKLLFILFSLIILTIAFLFIVLIFNRDSGRGALQVTSIPNKSKVYINGDFAGETPLCKCDPDQMLPTGSYTVKIIPPTEELSPFEQKIKISSGVLTAIDRTFGINSSSGSIVTLSKLSDKKSVELMVVSIPNDAKVFLDNNELGRTPKVFKNITPSDHEVKVSKESYADKIVKIRTAEGFRLEAQIFMAVGVTEKKVATASSSVIPQVRIKQTPTGFLRVRFEPSISSSESARVSPGDKFDLILEQDSWYQIKLQNGTSGWISSEFAEKL